VQVVNLSELFENIKRRPDKNDNGIRYHSRFLKRPASANFLDILQYTPSSEIHQRFFHHLQYKKQIEQTHETITTNLSVTSLCSLNNSFKVSPLVLINARSSLISSRVVALFRATLSPQFHSQYQRSTFSSRTSSTSHNEFKL
jgi:hypothetical protein